MSSICFLSPKAYPVFNPSIKAVIGGAEVQMSLLAKTIAENGNIDVSVIVADYGQPPEEVIDKVKLLASFTFNQSGLVRSAIFFRTLMKAHADVYVGRGLAAQTGLIALLCRLFRRKFVYMVAHDSEADGTHGIYGNIIGRFLAFLNFSLANKIIVQNVYEMDYLLKKYRKDKVFILKKGLESFEFKETQKKYDAVWVGRCVEWKNPDVFLNLAKEFKNKRFLMVAPCATGNDKYFGVISKEAKKLDNVEFVDILNNDEVKRRLLESKVFIFTSDKEGDWPMVVLEAASCGLPILSYKLNYDALIDSYGGGIYCAGNFDALKRVFDDVESDPIILNRMSDGARTYIQKNHDITINTARFLEIINL